MRRRSLTILALCCLPLSGCCSLARLFCGPDQSAWISVDYRTPELAVRTFLEALRRDDPSVLYQALSAGYRERLSVDEFTIKLVWPKIRAENPGLHLAGYADVPEPSIDDTAGTAVVELDVEGQTARIELTRECQWQVRFRQPEAAPEQRNMEVGARLPDASQLLAIRRNEDSPESLVSLSGLRVMHSGLDELAVANIDSVCLERTWRISNLSTR